MNYSTETKTYPFNVTKRFLGRGFRMICNTHSGRTFRSLVLSWLARERTIKRDWTSLIGASRIVFWTRNDRERERERDIEVTILLEFIRDRERKIIRFRSYFQLEGKEKGFCCNIYARSTRRRINFPLKCLDSFGDNGKFNRWSCE